MNGHLERKAIVDLARFFWAFWPPPFQIPRPLGKGLKQIKVFLSGVGKNTAFPSPPYLLSGTILLTHSEPRRFRSSAYAEFGFFLN